MNSSRASIFRNLTNKISIEATRSQFHLIALFRIPGLESEVAPALVLVQM